MLAGVRSFIGYLVSRFRFRRSREKVISFTHSLANAQSALVILPFGNAPEQSAAGLLGLLRNRFRDENITLVIGKDEPAPTGALPRSQVIRLSGKDVNFFYLPRPEILQRIKRKEYDVAIDLNLDFVLPSAYICKVSNARVRLGFSGDHADVFYNLQIHADRAGHLPQTYDRLARCLQLF